jgi:thymidylate synthase ThyX
LAPLVNKREYTEDEKIVLLHFFTNIDKNVYCATDALSSVLWAFLVGQYSRSDLSMRDRFLKLFEDAEETFKKGQIKEDEFVSLKDLADVIRKKNLEEIDYFNQRASDFLKKWGVDYGHNSLKDADRIRFAVEGVSQVFTKVIESPFPALGDFQEKSTRYMNFGRESIILPPSLMSSEFGDEVRKVNDDLIDLYEKYLPLIKDVLVKNGIIVREQFQRESAFFRTLEAKAFDIARYLLPSGVGTSLGASFSARACEYHLSEMLSHPLEEVRLVAKSMHVEAVKLSEGLLSHVNVNEYLKVSREASDEVANKFFDKSYGEIIKGLNSDEKVVLLSDCNLDDLIVASILFESSRVKGVSFKECQELVKTLSVNEKEEVMEKCLGSRGRFDRMPRALQHGTVLFEFITDFGAYRDYQRHRATHQIWQGVTGIHGFDYPEFIELDDMKVFKQDYDDIMTRITILSRKIIKKYPYDAEYVAALGHLVRTTYEMHPGQLAYVCELRTTPQGHHSYRDLFRQVYKVMLERAPLFMKYVRVNLVDSGTRKKQEERAAEKREKLQMEIKATKS